MVKSRLIDLRPKSAAAGDVSRQRRVATNVTPLPRYQKTHSTTSEEIVSLSNGGAKIIRLEPRAVASWKKPTLPMRDKDGEYNVIRFPQVAPGSALQRGGKTAKSHSKLLPSANNWNAGDYNHRMLENALAAAVLIVLVISGQWIFSTLLTTVP